MALQKPIMIMEHGRRTGRGTTVYLPGEVGQEHSETYHSFSGVDWINIIFTDYGPPDLVCELTLEMQNGKLLNKCIAPTPRGTWKIMWLPLGNVSPKGISQYGIIPKLCVQFLLKSKRYWWIFMLTSTPPRNLSSFLFECL